MTLRHKGGKRQQQQNAAAQPAKFGIDHFFARHRASQPSHQVQLLGKDSQRDDLESETVVATLVVTSPEDDAPTEGHHHSKRIRLSPLLPQTQDDGTEEIVWRASPTAERLHEQAKSPVRERKRALRPCQNNVRNLVSPSSKISPGMAGKLEDWLQPSGSLQAQNKENVIDGWTVNVQKHFVLRKHSPSQPPQLTTRASKQEIYRQAKTGTHRKVLLKLLDEVQTVISQDKSFEEETTPEVQSALTQPKEDREQEEITTKLASLRAEDSADCSSESPKQEFANGCFLVLEVSEHVYRKHDTGPSYSEKVLRVLEENNAAEKFVHLRDEWAFSVVRPGDTVNVVGEFQPDSRCIVDRQQNLLVLHPEVLISGSRVGSSFTCPRRAILDERVKSQDVTLAALLGTMLHRLFQSALFDKDSSEDYLRNRAQEIVLENIDGLYAIGADERDALAKLRDAIPVVLRWLHTFRDSKSALDPSVDFGMKTGKRRIAVSEVVDIEEMILSPKYGLKGMIDASIVVKSDEGEGKAMPLELKTGKATTGQAATEHRAQVILYTLLMSDRYSEDVSEGIIYYLNTDETQGVSVQHADLTGLMMRRNEHAGSLLSASMNQTLPPMLQNPHMCKGCRMVDVCSVYHKMSEGGNTESSGLGELYTTLTGHLSPLHADFFRHWDRLIDLENQISQTSQSEVWRLPSSQREEHGRCLSSMVLQPVIESENSEDFLYSFSKSNSSVAKARSLQDAFISGDCVLLSTESGHTAVAGGIIRSTGPSSITVALFRPLRLPGKNGNSDAIQRELWRIDKDDRGSSFATMRYNLLQLFVRDGARHVRQLIVDLQAPRFDSYTSISQDPAGVYLSSAPDLNDDQRSAIGKILTAGDYALILGMPGTGKTSTIVHAVQALLARGASILLASYTNSAVDNILLKLKAQGVNFIRVGRREAIHPELSQYALNVGVTSVEGLRNKIQQAQVVGATCFGVTSALFVNRKFDVCIIDEAGQITLPVCLGPLRYARTFVLVGDHYQLPPLVQSPEAREKGMAISLFRRLSEAHPMAVSALQCQYRMCADIMSLSNKLIYGNRLRCGSEAIAKSRLEVSIPRNLPMWMQQVLDPERRVLFLDTDLINSDNVGRLSSVQNITESLITMKIICGLKEGGVVPSSIGVISPYKAQVDRITQRLGERGLSEVEVHTIDKYQGRDKNCILVSFVRSKAQRISGSILTDWHRVNVAITRAKKKLILLGSAQALSSIPLLRLLIDQVDSLGGVLRLPEDTLALL